VALGLLPVVGGAPDGGDAETMQPVGSARAFEYGSSTTVSLLDADVEDEICALR
jgi:hypothetical protein